jgi:hypothetical protein
MRMRGLVPLLVLATAGCVSTNAAVLNPSVKLAPICPDGVQLFTSADKVGKDYREIALLNSSGQSGSTSEKGMYDSQRKKAAELGANGIIVNNINEPKAGTKIIGALFGTGAERKGSALAIDIPGDSARVRGACALKP